MIITTETFLFSEKYANFMRDNDAADGTDTPKISLAFASIFNKQIIRQQRVVV